MSFTGPETRRILQHPRSDDQDHLGRGHGVTRTRIPAVASSGHLWRATRARNGRRGGAKMLENVLGESEDCGSISGAPAGGSRGAKVGELDFARGRR